MLMTLSTKIYILKKQYKNPHTNLKFNNVFLMHKQIFVLYLSTITGEGVMYCNFGCGSVVGTRPQA